MHADEDVVGTSKLCELEKGIRDLERLLGRKTMEVEILKEAVDLARAKKPIWPTRLVEQSGGRYPMKAVADTLRPGDYCMVCHDGRRLE